MRGNFPAAKAMGFVVALAAVGAADEPIEFNRDIRPILSENCFHCHGPDKGTREADLRLDQRDAAIEYGAFKPGKADDSELVKRIFSADADTIMPPPDSQKKLKPAQKELLKRWIEQGAVYQPHWAYIPPTRPDLPKVKTKGWPRNPIDAFVLANLEAKKIAPSPEADRATLLRRLSLDLVGLPPTPEEVQAFETDNEPGAYERQVDRLLASSHFGERMAMPWLDLVRFSDTVGYHGDQNQRIFPYRDYVIDSFNRNKPFDQFTLEQLAGDLLPKPTTEQIVATGFNRLNMMTREGGAQAKEYLAKYAADRVRTVSITWLGSTMGCAECHDHKFDPFTSRDFYSLAAFFADVKQWGYYADARYSPNPELRGFSNEHPFPPEILVDSPYLKKRSDRVQNQLNQTMASSRQRLAGDPVQQGAFEHWAGTLAELLKQYPNGWTTPPVVLPPVAAADPADVKTESAKTKGDKKAKPSSTPPAAMKLQSDSVILVTGPPQKGGVHSVILRPGGGWVAAIRLELLPRDEHKGSILRQDAANASVSLSVRVRSKPRPLAIAFGDADIKERRYSDGEEVIGVGGAWRLSPDRHQSAQTAIYNFESPVLLQNDDELAVKVVSDALGGFRLSLSPLPRDLPRTSQLRPGLMSAAAKPSAERSAAEIAMLQDAYLLSTGWDLRAIEQCRRLEADHRQYSDGKYPCMVTVTCSPLPTRVLPRGNWQDDSGELLSPAVPQFLPQPYVEEGKRLNRLDLARWITSPANPLTARVFMNRLWKQYFGAGISGVMEDVGAQGEWPTHPDLLDWLAVEFMEKGWDVKRMAKLLVMSATYRQDSRLRPELRERDPQNRWLASQSPRRLEAEIVRDNALSVAGLLNLEVGGPSVKPYQPAGYYAALQFPNRDYIVHTDERQYRRGVYAHWQRTFLHPMLANFDAPAREECTACRTNANTPQQALTLLNDPTFVEASRVLAERLLQSSVKADEERIDWVYRRTLSRFATPKERASLLAFLATQRKAYRESPEDAAKFLRVGLSPLPEKVNEPELAAWTSVCRVVLNLHETITRY